MRIVLSVFVIFCAGVVSLAQGDDDSVVGSSDYAWVEYIEGFDNPVYLTHAGDGSGRLFVVEQTGFILIIEDGVYLPEPFLDITDLMPRTVFQGRYTEQGLFSLAFHPEYTENGYFFITYTDEDGHTLVARYEVMTDDPNKADPESRRLILRLEQPFDNHNSGQLAFRDDGYLYVGFGDGGSAGDPNNNGQNSLNWYGTILRIDINTEEERYLIPEDNPFVDDPDFMPEIWVYGLRNPWRFSFDRETGDLFIGDVGQEQREEISFQPADSPGGENYGWNLFEGTARYQATDAHDAENYVMPILEYDHSEGCSVTGGYVYRGGALPELQGQYIYGDYCNGYVWTAHQDDDGVWQSELLTETGLPITSFGEDEQGELYMISYKGSIYRLERVN